MGRGAPVIFIDGLDQPEALRWRDERLWFSDFLKRKIFVATEDGKLTEFAHVPGQPSGLGFALDGSLLVVSMVDRKLLSFDQSRLQVAADLSLIGSGTPNDMAVDNFGRAYIGFCGFDYFYDDWRALLARKEPPLAEIVLVTQNGEALVVARDLNIPNGIVVTDDGRTLLVAEYGAFRLTAFDVEENGKLSNRRIMTELGSPKTPDGIALDREGGIWIGCASAGGFLRVKDGRVVAEIPTPGLHSVSCAVGGADRETLFGAVGSHAGGVRRSSIMTWEIGNLIN